MKSLELNLPSIQSEFRNQFDGTLESALRFEKLHIVLNPTYTEHYFYVSGETEEDTITTKHTDGSTASWGSQTKEQESNSYILASELREFILSFNPSKLEDLVTFEEMRKYGKISNVRNRATFKLNGKIVVVSGLKL